MTSNNKVTKAHNNLFIKVFSEAKQAADFFLHHLPEEVVTKLDLSQMRQVPASFVDEQLKDRHTDLLFQTPFQGDPNKKTLLYLLFEHQSSFDPLMSYRLLAYMVRIWDWWLSEEKKSQKLPPILPAVLYHGQERWRGSLEFVDLLDLDRHEHQDLYVYMPNFRFSLTNLTEINDDEIGGEVINRLTLLLFKHSREPDLESWILNSASIFKELLKIKEGSTFLKIVVRYILNVNQYLDLESAREIFSKADEKVGEIAVTVFEQIEAQGIAKGRVEGIAKGRVEGIAKGRVEGIAKGRVEGIAKGRVEGRAEGNASMLIKMLHLRFGDITIEIVQRIEEATEEQLNKWAERLLTANSLEEIFLD